LFFSFHYDKNIWETFCDFFSIMSQLYIAIIRSLDRINFEDLYNFNVDEFLIVHGIEFIQKPNKVVFIVRYTKKSHSIDIFTRILEFLKHVNNANYEFLNK